MQEDQELLSAVIEGNSHALEQLYDLYFPRMTRFLLRITQDRELTAELINDVFMVVWEKADTFKGNSALSTWILGIAYHKALKAVKKRRWPLFTHLTERAAESSGTQPLLEHDIQALLQRLSPEHRAVLELTYYFGYSYREIAELLSCPENTVKSRMFYARRSMRSMMKEPTND